MFSGYLKICLNVLDTSGFFVETELEIDTTTRSEFEKSIKVQFKNNRFII